MIICILKNLVSITGIFIIFLKNYNFKISCYFINIIIIVDIIYMTFKIVSQHIFYFYIFFTFF